MFELKYLVVNKKRSARNLGCTLVRVSQLTLSNECPWEGESVGL